MLVLVTSSGNDDERLKVKRAFIIFYCNYSGNAIIQVIDSEICKCRRNMNESNETREPL
jgi:hypothetical protein